MPNRERFHETHNSPDKQGYIRVGANSPRENGRKKSDLNEAFATESHAQVALRRIFGLYSNFKIRSRHRTANAYQADNPASSRTGAIRRQARPTRFWAAGVLTRPKTSVPVATPLAR